MQMHLSEETEMKLTLYSHHLCPYVQRAIIALVEKNVPFDRHYINLANKPDWFLKLSPLGKTPVLKINDTAIFESTVILEYLEETQPNPLHPTEPLTRAKHRAWIEYGSSILNDIGGLYNAKDETSFAAKIVILTDKFARIETELGEGPYFNDTEFSIVDAVYGPVFRYFDVFDQITDLSTFGKTPKLRKWRKALAARPSVANAVTPDYNDRLLSFLIARDSHISTLASRQRAA